MNRKRLVSAAAVAVGIGLTALTAANGAASAQPGPPCGGVCQGPGGHVDRGVPPGLDRGRFDGPPPGLAWRGIDQGRFDHQPFNYNGNWVTPIFNPSFNNWGFWLFGLWIPL